MSTIEELLQQKRDLLEQKKNKLIEQRSIMFESPPVSKTRAGLTALTQGLTFGFSDEIGSALRASREANRIGGVGADLEQQSEAFDLEFERAMTESEFRRNELRKAFPMITFGGEVAGGAVTGGAAFKAATPLLKNIPTVPRLMLAGGAEGAAFGAGMARPGERAEGATIGGLFGLGLTPVAAGAGVATMSALRPVARRLGDSLLGTPKDRAVREIMAALDADDITKSEALTLMRSMGPNATLVDLGDTLARQGRVVTSEMGAGASRAKRFLDTRQVFQQKALQQQARRATGTNDYDRGIIELVNNAETKAAPLYDEIYSEVVDISPAMLDLLERPAMKVARKKAATILKNEGFSSEIIDDVTDVRYLDAIKRALDDQIGRSVRAGTGNQTRVLTGLKKQFVSEIDVQVPTYKEARSIFAGEQAIKRAADFGRNMFVGKKFRVADAREIINEMGESEIRAARVGFLDWLSDELAGTSIRRSTLSNKFADVPKFRQMAQLLFPDQRSVNDFLNAATTEARFAQTRNFITGGSPTARIGADRDAMTLGFLETAATAASTPEGMIASAIRLIKGNTKLTPEVLEEMAEILFNPKTIPTELRVNPLMAPFNIPRTAPSTTAGIASGATGSQVPGLIESLEQMGLLGQ